MLKTRRGELVLVIDAKAQCYWNDE